jgi:deoxycytidine triphosphate deaminase
VCQIWFATVSDVDVPYGEERGSQYQNQSGATASGFQFE